MNKPKLIIFDCDGTLVDSEHLNSRAVSEVLIELGYEKYTQEYCVENFTGMNLSHLMAHVRDSYSVSLTNKEVVEKFHEHGKILAEKYLQPVLGVAKVLENLPQDLGRCVASNGERNAVLHSLEITGLSKFFPEKKVFTYSQVKNPKPAPDIFLFAAEQMGYTIADCLVIEDSLRGICGAKAAGMKVFGFTGASHNNDKAAEKMKKEGVDKIIKNMHEILDYL